MTDTPFSLVVTTFNNADTLARCLASVRGEAEIIVLDSDSEDDTRKIAKQSGARFYQQPFAGYGPQKQAAIDLASHDWVLLLDADEYLSDELAAEIETLMNEGPTEAAYRLHRAEWLYWRWPHRWTRLTDHLRLFDHQVILFDDHPVHAAPKTDRPAPKLQHRLMHLGESDLATRVQKLNRYAKDAAAWRSEQLSGRLFWRLLLAPPLAFLRDYIGRRHIFNGLAGLITSKCSAMAAFLRYAAVLEYRKKNSQSKP